MDKKRLLFVDDEPMVLQGLKRTLRGMRQVWEMAFAGSGPEALDYLAQMPVDVVVSDMRMPGMDGAQLLETVKAQYPQIVRIILSGQLDREMTLKSVRLAHQHLSKPCDVEVLRSALERTFALNELLANAELKRAVARMDSLPSMPSICGEVMEEVQSPEASIQKVAAIIARDPAMAAKMLQMVNSAFFGLCRRVTDIKQAVMLLGLDAIRALVLSVNVFAAFNRKTMTFFDFDGLWQHSLVVGGLAKWVAASGGADRRAANAAFLCGMLHDIGKLILAQNFSDTYCEVLKAADGADAPLWQGEQAAFGASHAEAGAYLMGLWGIEPPLLAAIAFHHNPAASKTANFDLLAMTHLADAFARAQHKTIALTDPGVGLDSGYVAAVGVAPQIAAWFKESGQLQGAEL
jgi:HD-like signal output (HDOD) protein/CheY-like chemotaxis protein